MSELTLTVVTPDRAYSPLRCDSVHLTVCDNEKGRGGGSCGIRPGHIDALFALEPGPLTASLNGQKLLTARCGGGFATVSRNRVTVVTDTYSENE